MTTVEKQLGQDTESCSMKYVVRLHTELCSSLSLSNVNITSHKQDQSNLSLLSLSPQRREVKVIPVQTLL